MWPLPNKIITAVHETFYAVQKKTLLSYYFLRQRYECGIEEIRPKQIIFQVIYRGENVSRAASKTHERRRAGKPRAGVFAATGRKIRVT